MRLVTRAICVAVCAALLWQQPAMARTHASRRVLGVVVQTDGGRLDGAAAALGANVYSCDKMETDQGGVLRVKVGSSQLFLSGVSLAELEDDGSAVQNLAMAGTIGFSISGAGDFSVRTPAGVIRGMSGQAVSGQVTFTGPREIVISSMHGDLILDTGGEFRTIPDGKSANVTFENNIDNGCHEAADADQTQPKQPYAQHKIGFYLIMGAAVGVPTYFLWNETTESSSTPKK